MRVQRTRSLATLGRSPLTRRPLGARILSAALCLCLLSVMSCAKRQPVYEPKGPILKVFVNADGTILADGQPTTLDDLRKKFAELKTKDGAVWYSRANPGGDPPPHAMEVIVAITEARLPVKLEDAGK
jgi:hypothetical protein